VVIAVWADWWWALVRASGDREKPNGPPSPRLAPGGFYASSRTEYGLAPSLGDESLREGRIGVS